ncbi:MAG: DUF2065 domain-containing protein [Parvibaculum sp.]|nr:DUF2065 domain-containing protein [Parvibaculum sp.]
MIELLSALGLAIALEGVLYAAFPGPMRRALLSLATVSDQMLRTGGVAALALGVFIVWLVRG